MYLSETEGGFILLFTLILLVTLLAIVSGYLFLVTTQTRLAGSGLDDAKALCLAEAGLERGIREIRDDVLAPIQTDDPHSLGYHSNPSIDGLEASGTASNGGDVLIYDDGYASLNIRQHSLNVRVRNFPQLTNLLGTRLKNIDLGIRCRINRRGQWGLIDIYFTTDNWHTRKIVAQEVMVDNSPDWIIRYYKLPLSEWKEINSSDFGIEAEMIKASDDRRAIIHVDYFFIKPTYEVDASTEPWFFGFNNITLGDGNIERVDIIDEAGKVHLNYASEGLLFYLMLECGLPALDARNLAQNIINYRNNKRFDSIEELRVVPEMAEEYFNLIADFVTAYSFINEKLTRPAGDRAPVNINTASREVLEAIFDPLRLGGGLGPTGDAARLAQDIIKRREEQAFTYFYSSDPTADGTLYDSERSDFYGFINGDIPGYDMNYLNNNEKRRIEDNADASDYDWGGGNCLTTEFSYYTDSFLIDARGRKNDSLRQVKTVINDDGSRYLDTYIADPELTRYWREIRD